MKYLEHINAALREKIAQEKELVVYGQNVGAGSFISGFTKGFKVNGASKIINTTNTENSLVGFGFGVMLGGGAAAFFMKQLDFLFLGVDHLVNTYNIIRNSEHAKGSFTIMPIIVDHGYQGPQSSSNDFGDFCSIARIPGYALTNRFDTERIIAAHFGAPGFRIIGISQRLFKEDMIDPGEPVAHDKDMKYVQYKDGADATIVCFNFSFPYGWKLAETMERQGLHATVINVNYMTPIDWRPIIDAIMRTKNLIVIDDSKSENLSCFSLIAEARRAAAGTLAHDIVITRQIGSDWLNPVPDEMKIDYDGVVAALKR